MSEHIDTDNAEFQSVWNLINHTNQSIFLTGKAGTGKSTFLRYICENTRKKHIVLAPTGVAAINAGGSTIHSFFKMPFRPMLPDDPDLSLSENRIYEFLKYRKSHRKILQEVELIVIDEISMVRADMIDFIDRVLRVFSHNMRVPFGGKQLLLVGDIYQLEPVVTSDAREILQKFYPNSFFFSAKVFREMNLIPIELKKVYRQTEPTFIGMLDAIRINAATTTHMRLLNQQHKKITDPENEDFTITLATRRDNVDYINTRQLQALKGEEFRFIGEIKGDFPESSLPTQKELILKEQAQIIFIKNDYEHRWVNGTIGIVSHIDTDGTIHVILENGTMVDVNRDSWRNIRYTYNEKKKCIEEEELGAFIQYPIRLAWAITVHKSQGLTFNNVIIDFSGGAFAGGQTYVALSRCTSLEGITLKQPLSPRDIFIRPEIVKFSQSFNNQQLIDKSLKEASASELYRKASQSFDKGEIETAFDTLFEAVGLKNELSNPLTQRFIRKKLGIIHRLKKENEKLKEELHENKKSLKKYAQEYYLMGNECRKAEDNKAALANYEKALSLDPMLIDAIIGIGVLHFDNGDTIQSMKCMNDAVKLSPLHFKARYQRGKVRAAVEDYEGAVTDLIKAIEIKPQNPTAHDRLGDALSQLGQPELAAKQWQKATKLREKNKKK